MKDKYFCGTLKLVRFFLRREWLYMLVWVASVALVTLLASVSFDGMYTDESEFVGLVGMFENPAIVAMFGPFYGLDFYNLGTLVVADLFIFTLIGIALMNVFIVVRLTREDEERGRQEVIRSLPVGRLSALMACSVVTIILNVAMGLMVAIFLALSGISSDVAGAVIYGCCLTAGGLFFASASCVACQLSNNSKTAMGFSLIVLAVVYVVRGIGAVVSEVILALSPMGLLAMAQPFAKNNVLPIVIVVVIALALFAIAFWFNSIRDLDQGLIPQSAGRASASKWMLSTEGLAIRLLKGSLIAWAVGLFVISSLYGMVMGEIEAFIEGNEYFSAILSPPEGHTMTELFIELLFTLMAVAGTVPSVGAVVRLSAEENAKRYENIYSKAVSRLRVMAGYYAIGMVVSFAMLFISMFGLWLATKMVLETPIAFSACFSAMMVYLPALWVCVGLANLLVGLLPSKASLIAYGYIALSFVIVYIGTLINFPDWTLYLTPFGYVPSLPREEVNYLTMVLLALVGGVLSAGGFVCFKRRDIR